MNKFIKLYLVSVSLISLQFLSSLFPTKILASVDISNWTSLPPVNIPIASQYLFVNNSYLYSIGGANSITLNNGMKSEILINGNLNSWSSITQQPNRYWHSGINNNQYVYLIGGADQNRHNTNSILKGVIDLSGDITSWQETTPLPQTLSLGNAIIYNNFIYYAGGSTNGEDSSNAKSEIYKSEINNDGTLGTWTIAGALPHQMLGFGMIEHNGYLIILGGKSTGENYLSEVQKAQIEPITGDIGQWSLQSPLPDPVYRGGITKIQNIVISAGGYYSQPSFTLMDKVNFAEINLSGDITFWTTSSNRLKHPNCCMALTTWKNNIYEVGGWTGNYTSEVNFAQINGLSTSSPTPTPTPTPTIAPTPIPTPQPTIGPFELPFDYNGRPATQSATFASEFWKKATAIFDHKFGDDFIPFSPLSTLNLYDNHNGTDFGKSQTNGLAISVGNGKVIYTSKEADNCTLDETGYGCSVIIKYSGNLYALYAHLNSISVTENQLVNINTVIGEIGQTGTATGDHLHFGVLKPVNDKLVAETVNMMKNKDWKNLLTQIANSSKLPKFKSYCTFNAPNGVSFAFQDPSGWSGIGKDPWSLPRNKDGCGITSPYLWKYNIL